MSKKRSTQEELFCSYFARLQNGEEAAAKAGLPREEGLALLARPDIRERTQQQLAQEASMIEASALAGLRRLAFGAVNDGVWLAFEEEPVSPRGLDLYCVSEIRRPKGGGCEIKFHDRLEALKLLLEYGRERSTREQGSLLDALEKSAAACPVPEADPDAL